MIAAESTTNRARFQVVGLTEELSPAGREPSTLSRGGEGDAAAVTALLDEAAAGRAGASERLLSVVYGQLRAIAHQRMRGERSGHTLQATALVHEACMRLLGPRGAPWNGRTHFFNAAGEAMRRILIDHARARASVKRGAGRVERMSLEGIGNVTDLAQGGRDPDEIVAFDRAFERLETHDPRFAAVVRLRFYAGLSVEETARALGVSQRTVDNDWAYARAWLARELARLR
jgi:RNA polymerase sigma factor (TIGR02999 family)